MDQLDIFVLAVYLITVAYILSKAKDSLEQAKASDQKTRISLNQEQLSQELERRGLSNHIAIHLNFDGSYFLSDDPSADKQPKTLSLSVINNSNDAIYIDWDRSSLTDLRGRSRRVIRLVSYKSLDLSYPQVFSTVGPGQTLSEKITAEDLLERNAETETLEATKPLIDIQGLKKSNSGLYNDFMAEKKPLTYYLCLVLRMPDPADPVRGDRLYNVRCEIQVHKLPWTIVLPW
ncbi:MAG: hypothetical protein ACFE0I_12235 [Elainellaceae cyanobacterium]